MRASFDSLVAPMQSRKFVGSEETGQQDPKAQQPATVAMKLCRDCGMYKERDAFHLERRCPDGIRSICRACAAERVRLLQSSDMAHMGHTRQLGTMTIHGKDFIRKLLY